MVVVYVPGLNKRSGLVTPPGGAADPQFPTKKNPFFFKSIKTLKNKILSKMVKKI